MGETYRGLTIRFGGDTTGLQKALRGATAVISTTDSELRKLKNALKFDPGDVVALNVKLELLKEKSEGAYEKLRILNNSVEQLGKGSTSATELVSQYDRVQKSLSLTTQKYDDLDAALKKTKDQMNEIAEKSDLGPVFDKNNKEINGMVEEFAKLSPECDELAEHYRTLQAAHTEAFNTLQEDKAKAKLVDLATEVVKAQSNAKQLRQEFLELQGISIFNEEEASRFKEKLKEVETVIDMTEDEARRLREALDLDPTNIELAKSYIKAAEEETSAWEQKTKELQERIRSLEAATGIKATEISAREARTEFVKATDELMKWNKLVGEAEAELSEMEMELRRLLAAGKENTAEYNELAHNIDEAKRNVDELRRSQKEAKNAYDSAQAVTELKRLETEAKEAEAKTNSLRRALQRVGDSAKISASTFTTLGMAISQNISGNMFMAFSYSVQAAQDIDAAYRDMRKTVQGTEEDFVHLKEAAMEFASTHVTSADQILEIEAMGGQMGLAVSTLETFAETVANLNIATNIQDASQMAEILGQLSNIMDDLDESTFPAFSDSLVRLGNNNAALESDILEVTSRIGSMGSIVGFTTPEILAWATAIAATGQKSEAAGTAISRTMSDIETAVAIGGPILEQFAEVAGKSADEFAKEWKDNASNAMKSFVEGLRRIKEEGGSVDATLESMKISSVRQKQALEGLTQTVGTLNDAITMSEDAWNGVSDQWGAAGDAAIEAQKKSEGFSGQLGILKNNAQMLGAIFIESLAPAMKILNEWLQNIYDATKDWSDEAKLLTVAIAGLVTVAGPLATIIGPIATVTRTLGSDSQKAASAMKQAAGGMSTFQKAAIGLGVALAAIIIYKLIDYFSDLYEQQKKLTNATTGLKNAMKLTEYQIGETALETSKAQRQYRDFSDTIAKLSQKTKDAVQAQSDLADSIRDSWTGTISDIALAKDYQKTMKELAGSVNGSSEKYYELEAAVKGYNDITGSSIEILNKNTGELSLNADEIDKNTEAWQRNAKMQAYQDAIRESYKQNIASQKELNDLYNTRNELAKQYDPKMDEGEYLAWSRQMEQVNSDIKTQQDLYRSSGEAIDYYSDCMGHAERNLDGVVDNLELASKALGKSTDEFVEWANSLGVTTEEGVKNMANSILNGIEPNMAALLELTGMEKYELQNLMEEFGTSAEGGMAKFTRAIQTGTSPAVAAAMVLTNLTAEEFEIAADIMGYSGEEGVLEFANKILSHEIDASDASSRVASKAADRLDDYKDRAAASGNNFGSSFVNNILAWISPAATAAYRLGKQAADSLDQGIDSHSPSKRAMRSAYNFAKAGFIDTVAEYENEAYATAKRLGQYSVNGLDDGVLAMRDAAQEAVSKTLTNGASSSVTTNNNNEKTYITLNITADSETTLDSLIAQARRAKALNGGW